MRTPRMVTVTVLVVAIFAAGFGTAQAATPRRAPALSFQVGPVVRLMGDGAAAVVSISYRCSATRLFGANFGYAFVTVEVNQQFGSGQAADGIDLGGAENTNLRCDDQAHNLRILVFPSGSFAYRAGTPARATVQVLACDVDETACIQPSRKALRPALAADRADPLNQDLGLTATLGVDGTVTVLVPPGCPPGGFEQANVLVSQRVRAQHVTFGEASSDPSDCRRPSTPVSLQTAPFPARPKQAYVLINWTSCDATVLHCSSGRFQGLVTVN